MAELASGITRPAHFSTTLRARLRRDPLDHPRHKFADDFFFHEFAADVHACRARRRDPQLRDLVIGVELKSVEQLNF